MVSSWVPGCIRGWELDLTLLPCLLRRSYSRDYNIITSVRVNVSWHLAIKYIYVVHNQRKLDNGQAP